MWSFRSFLHACIAVIIGCFMFSACADAPETTATESEPIASIDTLSTCECFDLFAKGDSLPKGCLLGNIIYPNFNETEDFTNEILVSIDLINECQGPDSAQFFLSVMLDHCRDMPYLSKPESGNNTDSSQTNDTEISCEAYLDNCEVFYTSYMAHLNAFRNDPSSHDDIRELIQLAGAQFELFQIDKVRECLADDYELMQRYIAMDDTIRFGLGIEVDSAFAH